MSAPATTPGGTADKKPVASRRDASDEEESTACPETELTKAQKKNRKKKEQAKRKKQAESAAAAGSGATSGGAKSGKPVSAGSPTTASAHADGCDVAGGATSSSASDGDYDAERRFCVKLLRAVLEGELPPPKGKKVPECKAALSQLLSKSAPKVKKRMAMRNFCGNYRDLMQDPKFVAGLHEGFGAARGAGEASASMNGIGMGVARAEPAQMTIKNVGNSDEASGAAKEQHHFFRKAAKSDKSSSGAGSAGDPAKESLATKLDFKADAEFKFGF